MSAFLIDTDTMHAVCYAAHLAAKNGSLYPSDVRFLNCPPIELRGTSPDTFALTQLGRELFKLNSWALAERYGPNDEGAIAGIRTASEYRFLFKSRLLTLLPVQLAKQAHCLRYQCSEGDCLSNPAFQELQRICAAINEWAVKACPYYDQAEWGISDLGRKQAIRLSDLDAASAQ